MQAVSNAQHQSETGDTKEWKRSFVRAMNHLANQSALGVDKTACKSVGGLSVADSTVSKLTVSARQRAEAISQRRDALTAKEDDPHWDASTQAGGDTAVLELASKARQVEEMLRQNPDLRTVHSKSSAKALLERKELESVLLSAC